METKTHDAQQNLKKELREMREKTWKELYIWLLLHVIMEYEVIELLLKLKVKKEILENQDNLFRLKVNLQHLMN
jgi:hypothetical protein